MNGDQRGEEPAITEVVLAQLYRGELGRTDRWRTRLDTTSNWALTTAAATISFSFGASASHVTLIVGLWLVTTFLFIEARRYRYYDLWNRRLRLLEDGFWAPLLRHEPVDPDALKELAIELERPQIQLSLFSAVQTRLQRAYGSLLLVLLAAWFMKVYGHPPQDLSGFTDRARLGMVPGWLVTALLTAFAIAFLGLWLVSFFARAPLGELRARPRKRPVWESLYRPYAALPRRREHPPEARR
ncbi:MAG: DUF2270 domain-containing protein [Myxococcaceae bacterium]